MFLLCTALTRKEKFEAGMEYFESVGRRTFSKELKSCVELFRPNLHEKEMRFYTRSSVLGLRSFAFIEFRYRVLFPNLKI
ncbi:hypothetical protein CEXT_93101 [Caerostris extrusa]|uniref:Uncharacterized protein n=1 Tax=Caerostris extrusa TaxID=172846 RepID=A0AAV4N4W4_CAEEX|nr:hypothetical protein CEXT_93101 [Caerostris extrusa]